MVLMKSFVLSIQTLTVISWIILPVQANPGVSQEQAVIIAQQFTQKVAGSIKLSTATPIAKQNDLLIKIEHYQPDKAPNDLINASISSTLDNHSHGYWKISQQGTCHMEVDEVTGGINNYVNYTILGVNGNKPAGEAIPKSEAVKIAEYAIKATGKPTDHLILDYVQERQNAIPPKADAHEWLVSWLRTYQGISYRREGAGVFLAAETGTVISVRVDVQSSDPVTAVENMNREQALIIAEAQLKAVNLPFSDLPIMEIKKEIVPFNNYWRNGDNIHHTLQTRVVWNCHFGIPENNFEVWVDAETGDVVGGDYTGSLGGKVKTFAPKFGRQLKHSDIKKKAN